VRPGHGAVLGGLHPALQALLWVQALGLALYLEWGERRAQRLLFLGAWLFAALATMAKGPAGMVLPAMVVVAWVFTEKRPSLLGRMEIPAGVLVFLAVALPWFVAMYARHGQGFVDRLLFHDMFKRAFSHVHDTNEGDDTSFRYYLWQLGYATFPLVGLAPAAVLALVRDDAKSAHAATLRVLAGLWLVLTFCLFAFMGTKFHHYILPAVPALAVLVGLTLDELFESSREVGDARATHASAVLGAAMLGGAALTLLVGRDLFAVRAGAPDQARLLHLFTYNYKRPWPTSLDFRGELFWFSVLGAALLAALVVRRARRYAAPALVGLALVFTAFGLDRYFVATSPHWGQRELVLAWHVADQGAPGPLISYQQNWKGENFYTGNRIPAFVTSGKKFQDHVLELKRRGHKTFYFLTEPHRMGNLANELGNPAHFDRLVPPEVNNKFTLVRARFE
jgi:4-amino-4-deoxy-L-arabinose transferase-like glycosyltransferase